jgi:hypothetical protein
MSSEIPFRRKPPALDYRGLFYYPKEMNMQDYHSITLHGGPMDGMKTKASKSMFHEYCAVFLSEAQIKKLKAGQDFKVAIYQLCPNQDPNQLDNLNYKFEAYSSGKGE